MRIPKIISNFAGKIDELTIVTQNQRTVPTLFNIFGLRGFFYSEEHTPIHVHIVDSDGRVKIQVSPEVKLISNEGMKPRNVKRAMQLAKMYQEDIIAKWNEYHGQENQEN